MSESFDPYYKWLGIPPHQQPPTHYRLLGIESFEGNPDVIESAADQRMAHLRSFQTGKRGPLTQRLLNEVAAAKVCLLDPQKKVEYDAALREKLATEKNDAVSAEVFGTSNEAGPEMVSASTGTPRKSKPNLAVVGGSLVAVAVLAVVGTWMFLAGGKKSDPSPNAERLDSAKTLAAADPSGPPPSKPSDEQSSPPVASPGAEGAARGPSEPAQGPTEGIPTAPETSGQATGGVERPAPSAGPAPATTEGKTMAPAVKAADAPAVSAVASAPPSPVTAATAQETKKHSIPSADVQREVGGTIEETYKISEAKSSEAKLQLAKELSAAAAKSPKPDEQYVLLRKAVDLACDGGDAALMLETLGPMIDAFAIDPFVAKATMLERFTKGPRSPARIQSLAEASRAVIDDALAEDRYEIASTLAKTVADACSHASPQVRKEAVERRKRVGQLEKQFGEVQKALATLKANPDDADANLTAGSWYAFVKDDWKTGLAHLAKGSDAGLKALAQRETASPPANAEDQLKLADAWWDAAGERRGEEKAAMLRAAGHWYEQALTKLEGINKTKAEKRLSQIDELVQDSPSRGSREPLPAIAPFDAKQARGYQLRWARYLKVPGEFTNSIGMKFVLIPPGEFDMGSTEQEVERLHNQAKRRELPV